MKQLPYHVALSYISLFFKKFLCSNTLLYVFSEMQLP